MSSEKKSPEQEKTSIKSFESILAQLEKIVDRLESGQLDLENALSDYSHGVELSLQCQKILTEAELKIQVLDEKTQSLHDISSQ